MSVFLFNFDVYYAFQCVYFVYFIFFCLDSYSTSPPREKLSFSRSSSGHSLPPPPSARPFGAGSLSQEDFIFRQAQGILNKLTLGKQREK
jgi:hypothetical protein